MTSGDGGGGGGGGGGGRGLSARSPGPHSRTAHAPQVFAKPAASSAALASLPGVGGVGGTAGTPVALSQPGASNLRATLGDTPAALGVPPREHSSISIVAAESTNYQGLEGVTNDISPRVANANGAAENANADSNLDDDA
jgi:hypothetical protein